MKSIDRQVVLKNGDTFPSIIRGVWQLSQGHLTQSQSCSESDPIRDAVRLGFNTFDCADIYVGAEALLGEVRQELGAQSVRFHTKYVPDLDQLSQLSQSYTESIIDRSLKRLRVECLDLVQFHWWDYQQHFYLDALGHLKDLQKKGKIRAIGLTNFNSAHLEEILRSGFDIVSIQLQASLVDKRGQGRMSDLCRHHQVRMFGYGALLGGFMSSNWIGKTEPMLEDLPNRSLIKYKLLIDDWGGWDRFQSYLQLIAALAKKYQATMGQIAIQAVLQLHIVDAVIVGLSSTNYKAQNQELLNSVQFTPDDLFQLMDWKCPLDGDVYELERQGKHAKIMRYNANK
jgi:aryl-alcohol dehydrogenase-like predicted oxidoreductase